jgi:hypothetical protein
MVLRSPDEAHSWFVDQPESWAGLVHAVALSRAVTAEPTRDDLKTAAGLLHIECMGNAFACEITGDFDSALAGFQAAKVLVPMDQDAADGIVRVNDCTQKRPYAFRI